MICPICAGRKKVVFIEMTGDREDRIIECPKCVGGRYEEQEDEKFATQATVDCTARKEVAGAVRDAPVCDDGQSPPGGGEWEV